MCFTEPPGEPVGAGLCRGWALKGLASVGATGAPRRATGTPWTVAGVGVGMLRGCNNVQKI